MNNTRSTGLRIACNAPNVPTMSAPLEPFEIVTVQSGARSLWSREFGETFHPVIGPMAEARTLHVRQQRLAERARATKGEFVIWDVGLGAAANALAALEAIGDLPNVRLHSFDRTIAPLEFALRHADALEYLAPHRGLIETFLAEKSAMAGVVEWRFHSGDFGDSMKDPAIPAPHAVLYDPYSPTTNAGMWTLEHFRELHARLDPERDCLLTNYTRSTAVRVTLLLAGFHVGRGHATGEKEETTIAANGPGLLLEPLDAAWLGRVRRSTRSAPARLEGAMHAPIGDQDWQALLRHPQFAPAA